MGSNPLNFNDFLSLIQDGEPVEAGVPNRPITQLDDRTRYLWYLLQAANVGSTLFANQVTIEAAANVGMAVWFNPATNQFERAIAGVNFDPNSGSLVNSSAAQVWGIVFRKIDATLADLLLVGYATLSINAALEPGTAYQAGTYYLSRTTAGTLTAARPPIAVPVLRSDGAGHVFLAPQWVDLTANISPQRFRLVPLPAGTHTPTESGRNVITDPNSHVEGWLPASDAVFAGLAPHDAQFGYNIKVNPGLAQAWPPLSPQNALLFESGSLVPQSYDQGDGGLVRFDKNGIWWMSDCVGSCPFPDSADTSFVTVSESMSDSESPETCPHVTPMRLDLFFSQADFLTQETVVTSLLTKDPRISIFCQGEPNTPANTGPLQLALNLQFLADQVDPGGYFAFKSFDPVKQILHAGPMVSGIYSKNTNATLTGDAQQTVTEGGGPVVVFQGNVGIDVVTSFNRELFPDLVRLNSATEQYFEDVMYLAFEPGNENDLRCRIPVPRTLDIVNPVMQIQLRLFGTVVGTLPLLTLTYRRIPIETSTPVVLPSSDTSLTLIYSVVITTPNSYMDVSSNYFTVAAGDDILFTITRNGQSDSYTGEVGLLRIVGLLTSF